MADPPRDRHSLRGAGVFREEPGITGREQTVGREKTSARNRTATRFRIIARNFLFPSDRDTEKKCAMSERRS